MSWNLFNHNFTALRYGCQALGEAGLAHSDAYWPMTDPMVTPNGSAFFHAGNTYGPYVDGLAKQWQFRHFQGNIQQSVFRIVLYGNFNYCSDQVAEYKHFWAGPLSGDPQTRLYEHGVQYYVDEPWEYYYKTSHVLRLDSDIHTLAIRANFRLYDNDVNNGIHIHTGYPVIRFDMALDGTVTFGFRAVQDPFPEEIFATGFDIDKPYVVTSETRGSLTENKSKFTNTATMTVSQPGSATIVKTIVEEWDFGKEYLNVKNEGGTNYVSLGLQFGANCYMMGVGWGSDHAKLVKGLDRNYEDYTP